MLLDDGLGEREADPKTIFRALTPSQTPAPLYLRPPPPAPDPTP
jgi:hypothetical protein